MTEGDIWFRCILWAGMHCRGKVQGANHEDCEAAGHLLRNAGLTERIQAEKERENDARDQEVQEDEE
jgi:hypothetical protein